jgi:hypothetical protein
MSWGLPPKYKAVHEFKDASVEIVNQSVVNALMNTGFTETHNSSYTIDAEKRMGMTFLSFFAGTKPRIKLLILMTKSGRMTINSTYDYYSMFGIAMNDLGRQNKEVSILLEEIKDLVKRNIEFEKYGTVDGVPVALEER